MKTLLTKSQKTASAIVALMLGAVITFSAVMNSFGDTSEMEMEANLIEIEVLERAYADITAEASFEVELEETHTIKIYDEDDNLLEAVELKSGEVIEDAKIQRLINQADFLTEFNDTEIYKISK